LGNFRVVPATARLSDAAVLARRDARARLSPFMARTLLGNRLFGDTPLSVQADPSGSAPAHQDFSERSAIALVAGRAVGALLELSEVQLIEWLIIRRPLYEPRRRYLDPTRWRLFACLGAKCGWIERRRLGGEWGCGRRVHRLCGWDPIDWAYHKRHCGLLRPQRRQRAQPHSDRRRRCFFSYSASAPA
jgi:hypothetical protein